MLTSAVSLFNQVMVLNINLLMVVLHKTYRMFGTGSAKDLIYLNNY